MWGMKIIFVNQNFKNEKFVSINQYRKHHTQTHKQDILKKKTYQIVYSLFI